MQTEKNLKLIHKLMEYLIYGKNVPKLPHDVSFVPFSKNDNKLNKVNEELLENISKGDQPVVKAEEPSSSKEVWKLIPVNF